MSDDRLGVHTRRGVALTPWGKAALLGAALLVATGYGTETVIGAAVGLACVIDATFAFVGFRGRVQAVAAPPRTTVGAAFETAVEVSGHDEVLVTIPALSTVKPAMADRTGVARIRAVLPHRSYHEEFVAQTLRHGPLGLGLCTRRAIMPLRSPLVVLQRPAPAVIPTAADVAAVADASSWAPRGRGHGPVQQVREHHPEDGFRSIHWASTARRGALISVVREPPRQDVVPIVVALGTDGSARGDEVVARALTVGTAVLARGDEIELTAVLGRGTVVTPSRWPYFAPVATAPAARTMTTRVSSQRDLEILLSLAALGPLPPPTGRAYVIDSTGERWVGGPG